MVLSRRFRTFATTLLAIVVLSACSAAGPAPVAEDDVDGAATTLVFDDILYGVEAFVWRDDAPSVVDASQPGPCVSLCAVALVVRIGEGAVPDGFVVRDLIALIGGDERRFEQVEARGTGAALRPEAFEIVGRRGPDGIEVGATIDVLLRVTLPDGTRTLMRVRDVEVERTN